MNYFKTNLSISIIILVLIESSWPTLAFSIENLTNSSSPSSTTKIIKITISDHNNINNNNSVEVKKGSILFNTTGILSNATDLIDQDNLNNTFRERRQICK